MVSLNEFWIITSAGIPVYHQSIIDEIDQSLFGGFISALLSFIKELGEDDIRHLEMGGSKIVILSSIDKNWFFIARSDKKVKEKKINRYLTEIRSLFWDKFETKVANWDGNTDVFQELDEIIDVSNPVSPDKQKMNEARKSRGAFL